MKILRDTLSALACLSLSSFAVNAADLNDATEIVKKAELAAYYAGDDGRSAARMLITDEQGRKQTRQFIILRKDREDGGSQDMMVFFSRPADWRGTVFRVVKNTEQDDFRWLYLPELDLLNRISAGDKRTSFVGSHFFYEDVSGRSTDEDSFTLLSSEGDSYLLEGKPNDPASVEFARYEVKINKQSMIPVEIRFFNAQGQNYRLVEALKVDTIDGHPTVTHSKVSDLINGGHTEMQFRFISYDIGLPEDIFSERSMRTPPRDWLNLKD